MAWSSSIISPTTTLKSPPSFSSVLSTSLRAGGDDDDDDVVAAGPSVRKGLLDHSISPRRRRQSRHEHQGRRQQQQQQQPLLSSSSSLRMATNAAEHPNEDDVVVDDDDDDDSSKMTTISNSESEIENADENVISSSSSSSVSAVPVGGGSSSSSSSSSSSIQQQQQHYWTSVVAILAAAFLNLLGFTMAGPITPALGQHFGLTVGPRFGSLTSAYPLGMLLGLFLWPQMSDRIGRKPVMVLSLLGSGLGLTAQALVISSSSSTSSLGYFLASRILTGSFAGSSPVSKAFLADIGTASGQLPRYLAWRDAASTLAFIVGPLLGGLVYDFLGGGGGGGGGLFLRTKQQQGVAAAAATTTTAHTSSSLSFVIGFSAVASMAAALLIFLFVHEVSPPEDTTSAMAKTKNQEERLPNLLPSKKMWNKNNNDDGLIIACPLGNDIWSGVASVCCISFLFNVGDSTFHAFFSALLKHQLTLSARTIGLAYTILACVSLSVSTGLTSVAIQTLGPVSTCFLGLCAVGGGLLGLSRAAAAAFTRLLPNDGVAMMATSSSSSWVVWVAAALYYVGVPLYGPTIPTMLLRCVPPNKRGTVMGLDGVINTVARVISPLLMGTLYASYGPTVAFGVAGFAACSGALLALIRRTIVMVVFQQQQQQQPNTTTTKTATSSSS